MNEVTSKEFTHLKIHTQYSICEGALRTYDLAKYCKTNQIKAVGLCDSNNLCGALEFSESIAKCKTQPIIGSQINIEYKGKIGKIPLFAKNLEGYKNLIKLSSKSYIEINDTEEPHCEIEDLEKKIDDRLQKPFFTDMLILAAATGTDHFKYKKKIKELAIFIREKLQERNLIKKLKYRPKEFWNFKGKKSIYNIDGGQLSLSVKGAAALGLRVAVYKVRPGEKSDQREDSDESTTLTANLIDKATSHYEQEDDTFMLEYNKMLTGTRMIMETAEVVKQIAAKGKWKEKSLGFNRDSYFCYL